MTYTVIATPPPNLTSGNTDCGHRHSSMEAAIRCAETLVFTNTNPDPDDYNRWMWHHAAYTIAIRNNETMKAVPLEVEEGGLVLK